ncbi:hypothetical protein D0865_04421 [Hortaea werneckii]|uniref:Fungal N-terminal domain-containing protein n=1 Tax=Hortaea werneckii TaxID=91943 RepID=A0A3M7CTI8_HORWE|nr:hypothetical protein D0865_04421 [Hortaea werneckii]
MEVAAGVVGIAGFGIQLAESVVKLKRFCSEVKGARRKLEGLTQELEVLVAVTKTLPQKQAGPSGICNALEPSLSLCNSASGELARMIDGLLEKMKRSKLTGSLKAVIFDQEIGELVGKIERTKSLLILTSNLCIPEQILAKSGLKGRIGYGWPDLPNAIRSVVKSLTFACSPEIGLCLRRKRTDSFAQHPGTTIPIPCIYLAVAMRMDADSPTSVLWVDGLTPLPWEVAA